MVLIRHADHNTQTNELLWYGFALRFHGHIDLTESFEIIRALQKFIVGFDVLTILR